MSQIEEALRPIVANPGVLGVLILSDAGIPLRWWKLDSKETVHYAAVITPLIDKARALVKNFDKDTTVPDFLRLIRLKSNQHEILVTPEEEYSLVVIQGLS
ncbi:hypothetical protein PCE1_000599 [Barthelona sp. PCE]